MEEEQLQSGDPQKNKSSENEEQRGSVSKKARRKKQTGASNKTKKHIEKAASLPTLQSTEISHPRPTGVAFVFGVFRRGFFSNNYLQRRQGSKDQSPSPNKPSTAK